jgi:hypothetical protein
VLNLLSLIVVPAEDVGEVLLILGIGILPFLMLGCQALTNSGVN